MQPDVFDLGTGPGWFSWGYGEERTAGFGRTDQAEASGIKTQKLAQPRCLPTAVAQIVSDRSLVVGAHLNGQSFGQGAAGQLEIRGEERTDVGLLPAIVHPIAFTLS